MNRYDDSFISVSEKVAVKLNLLELLCDLKDGKPRNVFPVTRKEYFFYNFKLFRIVKKLDIFYKLRKEL